MPSVIHETILKDIVDIIGDAEDLLSDQDKVFDGKNNKFSSLTRTTKNLILVFPVLCTKGISIETASMISKAIEKKCVVLLELLFASVQITDTTDLSDYISRFHSNISTGDKISVDDFIDFTSSIGEAAEAGEFKITDYEAFKMFKESMNNFSNEIKTTLNENSLADFNCYRESNANVAVLEAKKPPRNKYKNNPKQRQRDIDNGLYDDEDNSDNRIKPRVMVRERKNGNRQTSSVRSSNPNTINRNKSDLIDKYSSNDIKKANELMPTKVVVNFYSKDKETGNVTKLDKGIIGVKCKLYSVDSIEIIERISTKYADSNWVRELVRATTGEISFWRDFIFALDRAKIDAINSAKKGSSAKMFKVLERRATKNRLSKWKANRADSAPITTLVVSQDEVEYLKKDYDVNLENRNIALKLMESYNLMGLVIADEPAESASFIWDEGNDASWETLSFRNLERESDDKNYRKVISLMTKISR